MGEVPIEPADCQGVLLNSVIPLCTIKSTGNSKEKTPMCLVNELARYNQIPHQYRLTHEDGPAHKKMFTVTLKLGDEEYQADGSSIKKAQHSAAQHALTTTGYKHPPEKCTKPLNSRKNITPTVELNALAMKRGEVTEYTFLDGSPQDSQSRFRGRGRGIRGFRHGFRRGFHHPGFRDYPVIPSVPYSDETYRVLLKVGEKEYKGCGVTPQAARHDAATQALTHMRELIEQDAQDHDRNDGSETATDSKSPVSLVHEKALKRKLPVTFVVVEEKGQPHMRLYLTKCTVGEMVTMGEGNGKKISKGKAAELMLAELARLPEIPEPPKSKFKKRMLSNALTSTLRGSKRKPGRTPRTDETIQTTAEVKPTRREEKDIIYVDYIQELASYQSSQAGPEPCYTLVETKVMPNSKKKEFSMQVSLEDRSVLAVSSSKKGAMKNAAHMMLIELGVCMPRVATKKKKTPKKSAVDKKVKFKSNGHDAASNGDSNGPASSETVTATQPTNTVSSEGMTNGFAGYSQGPGGDQLLAGRIFVNHSTSSMKNSVNLNRSAQIAQEYLSTGSSQTAESLTRRRRNRKQQPPLPSHPIEQLDQLAQLTGFNVHYSDFPNSNSQDKDNPGFLSLVQLSTTPPQVCTGVGPSIEEAQNQAAISALQFISDLGLESIVSLKQDVTPTSDNRIGQDNTSTNNGSVQLNYVVSSLVIPSPYCTPTRCSVNDTLSPANTPASILRSPADNSLATPGNNSSTPTSLITPQSNRRQTRATSRLTPK